MTAPKLRRPPPRGASVFPKPNPRNGRKKPFAPAVKVKKKKKK